MPITLSKNLERYATLVLHLILEYLTGHVDQAHLHDLVAQIKKFWHFDALTHQVSPSKAFSARLSENFPSNAFS